MTKLLKNLDSCLHPKGTSKVHFMNQGARRNDRALDPIVPRDDAKSASPMISGIAMPQEEASR